MKNDRAAKEQRNGRIYLQQLMCFPDNPDKKWCGMLQCGPHIGSYLGLIDFESEVQRLTTYASESNINEKEVNINVRTSRIDSWGATFHTVIDSWGATFHTVADIRYIV